MSYLILARFVVHIMLYYGNIIVTLCGVSGKRGPRQQQRDPFLGRVTMLTWQRWTRVMLLWGVAPVRTVTPF